MFFGIFVFGPLQSSVVNVCTIQINIRGVRVFDFGPQQFSTCLRVFKCLEVERFSKNRDDIHFYIGFPDYETLIAFWNYIEPTIAV